MLIIATHGDSDEEELAEAANQNPELTHMLLSIGLAAQYAGTDRLVDLCVTLVDWTARSLTEITEESLDETS